MLSHKMGIFFTRGWAYKAIFGTAAFLVLSEAFVKYEYGIPYKHGVNTTGWDWWYEQLEQKSQTGNKSVPT